MTIRYAKPAEGAKIKPETLLEIPLDDEDLCVNYNLSPDGKEFIATIAGKSPRLLFIPLKEKSTAKDIRTIELKSPVQPTTTTSQPPATNH